VGKQATSGNVGGRKQRNYENGEVTGLIGLSTRCYTPRVSKTATNYGFVTLACSNRGDNGIF